MTTQAVSLDSGALQDDICSGLRVTSLAAKQEMFLDRISSTTGYKVSIELCGINRANSEFSPECIAEMMRGSRSGDPAEKLAAYFSSRVQEVASLDPLYSPSRRLRAHPSLAPLLDANDAKKGPLFWILNSRAGATKLIHYIEIYTDKRKESRFVSHPGHPSFSILCSSGRQTHNNAPFRPRLYISYLKVH